MLPIVRDGLVLEMHFNELNGSTVYDLSGNNNHGTIYGATRVQEGFGRALLFDGVDDYVKINYSTSMNLQQAFTFSAWVYPVVGGIDWRNVVGQIGVDDGIFFMGGNYFMGSVWVVNPDGSKTRLWVGGTPKQISKWYFVVFTGISGVGYKLYVNGILENEVNDTRPHQNLTTDFYVGGFDTRCFFSGIIDDVLIYNRALSDDEIKAIYNYYMKKRM